MTIWNKTSVDKEIIRLYLDDKTPAQIAALMDTGLARVKTVINEFVTSTKNLEVPYPEALEKAEAAAEAILAEPVHPDPEPGPDIEALTGNDKETRNKEIKRLYASHDLATAEIAELAGLSTGAIYSICAGLKKGRRPHWKKPALPSPTQAAGGDPGREINAGQQEIIALLKEIKEVLEADPREENLVAGISGLVFPFRIGRSRNGSVILAIKMPSKRAARRAAKAGIVRFQPTA